MKAVFANLKRHWYWYLIVTGVASGSMVLLTRAIHAPKAEETIGVFAASASSSDGTLYHALLENKPDYLREIRLTNAVIFAPDFDYLYAAFGKADADLILLPESKIDDSVLEYYYCELNQEYMDKELPGAEYYCLADSTRPFGVKMREKGNTKNKLLPFSEEDFDEDYYAFFGKYSLHAGANNSAAYSTAIDFARFILEASK